MEAPRMPAFRRDGSVLESFPQSTTATLAFWH